MQVPLTPTAVYKRLNKIIWYGRLPEAIFKFVPDATIPECYGITIHDELVVHPVILLNETQKNWGNTLVHEAVHVAEPQLRHGVIFDALVETYWRIAKKKIKGLR